jgi:hypothetical protein
LAPWAQNIGAFFTCDKIPGVLSKAQLVPVIGDFVDNATPV